MELPNSQNVEEKMNSILKDDAKSKKLKTLIVSIAILILVGLGIYYFLHNKALFNNGTHIYTDEEKLKILEDLNVPPINDGSVQATVDQKNAILDRLNKTPKTTKKLTPEEQQKIIDSIK